MKLDKNRVVVGMSGGVDSSVAAALLVEQGYDVIGITIKTYKYEDVGGNVGNDSSCCSLDGINDARRICMDLGIPHYVVDFTETFKKQIIDYFVEDYIAGRTPNPCVKCNRHIKWEEMLKKADSLGAYWIATGHYANIHFDVTNERYILSRGNDANKDQSYALWGLTQTSLSRTIFPLAGKTKTESRAEGERLNLGIEKKGESYEICFIPDNDYKRFLKDMKPNLEQEVADGDIVLDGNVIGKHSGYPFYTIGQRKGLGIAHPEPLYVLEVLEETNSVIVGTEEKLYHNALTADSVNLIAYSEEMFTDKRLFTVKIRYKDKGDEGLCFLNSEGKLEIHFSQPRSAITPGQSVVMYDGDVVVGGGIISSWFDV